MKYYVLSSHDASLAISQLERDEQPAFGNLVSERGSGDDTVDAVVAQTRLAVIEEVGDEPSLLTSEDEARLVPIVHTNLSIPSHVAADAGFWRWLQLAQFFDIVQRRHGQGGQFPKPSNFGLKGVWEGLIARIWFRGEIAYVAGADDPYRLARKGDQDFWRSHILRRRYACGRHIARALISFQYPESAPTTHRLHASNQQGVRELVKRLRRAHATRALELMPEAAVESLLHDLSRGLT